jgi:hypothetical protein
MLAAMPSSAAWTTQRDISELVAGSEQESGTNARSSGQHVRLSPSASHTMLEAAARSSFFIYGFSS